MAQEIKNKPLSDEMHEKFLDLAYQMSPENLSCDGELSKWEVGLKLRKLTDEWNKLEMMVGRIVYESEVWEEEMKWFPMGRLRVN